MKIFLIGDNDEIDGQLNLAGFTIVDTVGEADIILYNHSDDWPANVNTLANILKLPVIKAAIGLRLEEFEYYDNLEEFIEKSLKVVDGAEDTLKEILKYTAFAVFSQLKPPINSSGVANITIDYRGMVELANKYTVDVDFDEQNNLIITYKVKNKNVRKSKS